MSRTKADLRFKALSILVGGDIGQVPSAEDATALDNYIDDAVDELAIDGAIYISDLDAIENGIFGALAHYVANMAADEFGGKSDATVAVKWSNRLRVLSRQTPGYGPQQVEFF